MAKRIASGLQPILTGIFSGLSQGMSNYDAVQNVATDANRTPTSADQANGVGEGTRYVTGQSGTQYQLPDMGYGTQFARGSSNAALHYMLTGDANQAVQYAAQKEQDAHDIYYRAKVEAPKKDAMGYPPENIQAWIQSGNPADLTRNLGNRAEMINGHLTMMTAEQAQARDNAAQNQANNDRDFQLRQQELQQQQRNADRAQANIEYNRGAVAGHDAAGHPVDDHGHRLDIDTSGTGTDDTDDSAYSDDHPANAAPAEHKVGDVWKDSEGQYHTMKTSGAGVETVAASKDQMKAYDAAHPDETTPSANQTAATKIGADVQNVSDDTLSAFTGGMVKFSRGGHYADAKVDAIGGETKRVYQEGKRLEGLAVQRAIQIARASQGPGSGAFTDADQRAAAAAAPQLDYTSPESYKRTLAALVEYVNGGEGFVSGDSASGGDDTNGF